MASPSPPKYEDIIFNSTNRGKDEDLAYAQTLVPNTRILAALRPSEDAANVTRV
jgi:hypothetical protein